MARLGGLKPHTLATMHGSSYVGDGQKAFEDLAVALKELLGSSTGSASLA